MQRRILLVATIFLVLLGVSFLSVLPAHAVIYVSNVIGSSITTWPDDTTGNIAPTTNIVGATTTLNSPWGVAVDGSWIYVANASNNSVDVFPINADGNAAPTRSIQGASTILNYPDGVAVDGSWIYVANQSNNSIVVFPIGADGNAAPTRSIQGASTTLSAPWGVAVDGSWIYVANVNNDSVDVFPINADGNAAPTRSIQGASTTLNSPVGVAVDGSWIYVTNNQNNSVDVFPINADGNAAPTRSIQGASTTLNRPYGVAVDGSWIYVASYLNNRVDVFSINADGDIAPARSIQGASTTLNRPGGIAVSAGGTVDLPETGQTTCYDTAGTVIPCATTGQDGDIQAGVAWPAPRFTDNGDGTVTDNLTGLIWLQNANCFGTQTWANAINASNTLNSTECGLSDGSVEGDWRLPNVNELESLINAEEANTATWLNDPAQGFTNVQSGNYYWSSSTYASNTVSAWYVNMSGHVYNNNNKTDSRYVWPVRASTTPPAELWETGQTTSYAAGDDGDLQRGVAWPSPRFTDNGDGTVTDNLTGLIWLQNANCFGSQTWANALNAANTLNSTECGLSDGSVEGDWRLSNRKELHSLTDFSQYNPALPSGYGSYFTNVLSAIYWSSSTYADNTVNAWYVNMYDSAVIPFNKTSNRYVWPVRAGCTASFPDISTGHWAEDYIKAIFCAGITTGFPDGTYRPESSVTRAQMATFLIRALYGESFSYGSTPYFPDLSAGHWAFKYVQRLYEDGITTGFPDGTYRPESSVTRAQMAAFLSRAFLGMP